MERLRGERAPDYETTLRRIGDRLLEINARRHEGVQPQLLSTAIVQEVAGFPFYNAAYRTPEQREQMHRDLLALDGRYADIGLQNQIRNRSGKVEPLHRLPSGKEEEEIITDAILGYMEAHQTPGGKSNGKLPSGTYAHVTAVLNAARQADGLLPRSRDSVKSQTYRIYKDYHQRRTFTRGSPAPSSPLEIHLTTELDLLGESELEAAIAPDPEKKERKAYLKLSSFGHQALVAYLMDPENYHALLPDAEELVAADFTQDNTPPELFSALEEAVRGLHHTDREAELVEFVDRWLRCDLIYRKKGGGYLTVEVKQNAINTERFPNADKARQQVAAYASVLLDNIRYANEQNRNTEGFKPLKESVKGVLAAYTIDQRLEDHLTMLGDRGAITVSRDVVMAYIEQRLQRRGVIEPPNAPMEQPILLISPAPPIGPPIPIAQATPTLPAAQESTPTPKPTLPIRSGGSLDAKFGAISPQAEQAELDDFLARIAMQTGDRMIFHHRVGAHPYKLMPDGTIRGSAREAKQLIDALETVRAERRTTAIGNVRITLETYQEDQQTLFGYRDNQTGHTWSWVVPGSKMRKFNRLREAGIINERPVEGASTEVPLDEQVTHRR